MPLSSLMECRPRGLIPVEKSARHHSVSLAEILCQPRARAHIRVSGCCGGGSWWCAAEPRRWLEWLAGVGSARPLPPLPPPLAVPPPPLPSASPLSGVPGNWSQAACGVCGLATNSAVVIMREGHFREVVEVARPGRQLTLAARGQLNLQRLAPRDLVLGQSEENDTKGPTRADVHPLGNGVRRRHQRGHHGVLVLRLLALVVPQGVRVHLENLRAAEGAGWRVAAGAPGRGTEGGVPG